MINYLRHPILYRYATDDPDTNGLGSLADALSVQVVRTRNAFPTMQMVYRKDGINADKLQQGMIIMTDCGPDSLHQKFRISSISKTQDNIVVDAIHIAGDVAFNTITKDISMASANAVDVWNEIFANSAYAMPDLTLSTDVQDASNIDMQMSSGTIGDLLIAQDQIGDTPTQSMAALFDGEWTFDNYRFGLYKNAGRRTNIAIKYGRNLKTIQQDKNISDVYTAGYFYAKYTPEPPKTTASNVDWSNISTNFSSNGSATYMAGGTVSIYNAPTPDHTVIGSLSAGAKVVVDTTNPISPGMKVTSNGIDFEADTANGNTWYHINSPMDGWVDSSLINFDKSGNYLVSSSEGHFTADVTSTTGDGLKYTIPGGMYVYVSYKPSINIWWSPFDGPDKYKTGRKLNYGDKVKVSMKAYNGSDIWYKISGQEHSWIYGPHLNTNWDGAGYASVPVKGTGYIDDNAQKYYIDKKGNVKKASGKTKSKAKTGTSTSKLTNKNGSRKSSQYTAKISKATVKKGWHNVTHTVTQNGHTYYEVSNGVWVKSSDIDYNKKGGKKPESPTKIISNEAKENGKFEMYSDPALTSAINWAIPDGAQLELVSGTGNIAKRGDGGTSYYVTYAGKSGWVDSKYLSTSGDADLEPSDAENEADDTDSEFHVNEVTVSAYLRSEASWDNEIDHVQNVDLSSYFQHDPMDKGGLQADSTYVASPDDIAQLNQLAQAYMTQNRFGKIPVSLTIDYQQLHGILGPSTLLGLYDIVGVDFAELGVQETAEVNSVTWDALAHEYTSITVGDIPVSYEHLLLQAANDNANSANVTTNARITNTESLIGRYRDLLKKEGSDRQVAEKKLMEDLGAVKDLTTAHGKQIAEWTPIIGNKGDPTSSTSIMGQLAKLDQANSNLASLINSGGSSIIHAVGGWANPTALTARSNSGGYMMFNSEGLGYYDSSGSIVKSAIGSDGTVYADAMYGGYISAAVIDSATITGAFQFSQGGINVMIGGTYHGTQSLGISGGKFNGGTAYLPVDKTINGIGLSSANYSTKISSGSYKIWDNGNFGGLGIGNVYDDSSNYASLELHPHGILFDGHKLGPGLLDYDLMWRGSTILTSSNVNQYVTTKSGITKNDILDALNIPRGMMIMYSSTNATPSHWVMNHWKGSHDKWDIY